jgi:hypothetical protein
LFVLLCLQKLAMFWVKIAIFFFFCFGENIYKMHNIHGSRVTLKRRLDKMDTCRSSSLAASSVSSSPIRIRRLKLSWKVFY